MPLKLVKSPFSGQYYPVQIAGETPTEAEKQRIREHLMMLDKDTPSVEQITNKRFSPQSGFFGNIGIATQRIKQNFYDALDEVNREAGNVETADYFANLSEEKQNEIQQKSRGLTRLKDIDTFGEGIKYGLEAIGGAVPYLAVGAASATGAGAIARRVAPLATKGIKIAQAVGGFAPNLGLLFGENIRTQKENLKKQGIPVTEVEGAKAFGYAIPAAMLESIGLFTILGARKAGLTFNPDHFENGSLFKKLVFPATGKGRIGAGVATGAVAESLTEFGQAILNRKQAGLDMMSEEAQEEYLEALVAGGIAGGAIKGTLKGAEEFANRKTKADAQTELNNDLNDEYARNLQTQEKAQEGFSNNPQLLIAEEGGIFTDGLSKSSESLSEGDRTAKTVKAHELNDKQLAEIRKERAKRGVGLDENAFPITLEEIRATLGEGEYRRFAAKQGVRMAGISTEIVNKYSYDQYKRILNEINKNAKTEFSEGDLNKIIHKTTGSKSSELTEAIRNELIGRDHLRATQNRNYTIGTGLSIPVGEVEFQKVRKFKKGRLAKESDELLKRIQDAEEQLETKQIEGRKERGKKRFTIPTLSQRLQNKIDEAAKLEQLKDAVTDKNLPMIIKQLKPYIDRKRIKKPKDRLEVYKSINSMLGKIKTLKPGETPTGIRKEIDGLQEQVENLKRGIERDKQAYNSLQITDFSTMNVKRHFRGSRDGNDPKALFYRQYDKQRKLVDAKELLQIEKAKSKELLKKIKEPSDEVEYEAQENIVRGLEEEIQKLERDIAEIKDIRAKPSASVTQNQAQEQSNQMNATANLATAKPFTPEYRENMNAVANRLSNYLKKDLKLSPDRVKLITETTTSLDGKRFVFGKEQREGDNKRVITLAMQLFDADTINDPSKQDEIFARLKGTLNHEVLHSLRALGLFTPQEFDVLVKAANTRKKVIWREGELLERQYTYLDRAKRIYRKDKFPNLDDELYNDMVQEEAVADMFQDAMDDKLKLGGKPKSLLNRIIDFFKSIFFANEDNEFIDVSDIIQDVKSGKIGSREAQEISSDDQVKFSLGADALENAERAGVDINELDVYSRVDNVNANKPPTDHLVEFRGRLGNPNHGRNPVGYRASTDLATPEAKRRFIKTVFVPTDLALRITPPRDLNDEVIESIAEGIKDYDVKIQPPMLTVGVSEDGKSLMTMGHEGRRRIRALKKLGYKHVAIDLFSQYEIPLQGNPATEGFVVDQEFKTRYDKADKLLVREGLDIADPDKSKRAAAFSIDKNNLLSRLEGTRDIDALGFYSKALQQVELMPQKKGTGEQFLQYLRNKGVKKDELYWTGIQDFLETNDKVTKDDLVALIRANRIYLKEIEIDALGDPSKIQPETPLLKPRDLMPEVSTETLLREVRNTKLTKIDPYKEGMQLGTKQRNNLILDGAINVKEFIVDREIGDIGGLLVKPQEGAIYQIVQVNNLDTFPDVSSDLPPGGTIDDERRQQFFLLKFPVGKPQGLGRMSRIDTLRTNEKYNNQKYDLESLKRDSILNNFEGRVRRLKNSFEVSFVLTRAVRAAMEDAEKNLLDMEYIDKRNKQVEDLNKKTEEYNKQIVIKNIKIARDNDIKRANNIRVSPAKYENVTMKGGSNYKLFEIELPRELYPKLKNIPSHNLTDAEKVLVHVRFKERIFWNGERVLYIEEIQSDWGQRGKKEGFALEPKELKIASDKFIKDAENIIEVIREVLADSTRKGTRDQDFTQEVMSNFQKMNDRLTMFKETKPEDVQDMKPVHATTFKIEMDELMAPENGNVLRRVHDNNLFDKAREAFDGVVNNQLTKSARYPKGPFVTETEYWTKMILKRILKKASDDGFRYVTFPDGENISNFNMMPVAGVEFYNTMIPSYLKGKGGVIRAIDPDAYLGTYLEQVQSAFGKDNLVDAQQMSALMSIQNGNRFEPESAITVIPTGDINQDEIVDIQEDNLETIDHTDSKYMTLRSATAGTTGSAAPLRGSQPIVKITKALKKYYDTFFDEDGNRLVGADIGSSQQESRSLRQEMIFDHQALSTGHTVELTTKLINALDDGQELFSLGYDPNGDNTDTPQRVLLDKVIGALSDQQYLVSSLPELEDDPKGMPTLSFRNLMPRGKKRPVVDVMRDYLKFRQERAGDFRIDLNNVTEGDKENIAQIMAAEAEVALARDNNAIGWYDAKFKTSKNLISIIRPEILDNPENEAAFDFALAVTSNGISVIQNFDYALQQYDSWVASGNRKFDERGFGEASSAMVSQFKLYNALSDVMQSDAYERPARLSNYPPEAVGIDIEYFLDRDVKVRDLINDPLLKKVAEESGISLSTLGSQEKKDTVVKMSTIIGSKIGGGFYQNLRGNYNPLTMDRWWMRYFNRITGNPFVEPQDQTQLKNYNDFLTAVTVNRDSLTPLEKRLLKQAKSAIGDVPLRRDMIRRTGTRLDQRVIDLATEYSSIRNRYFMAMSKIGIEDSMSPTEKDAIRLRNRTQYGILEKPESVLTADRIKRNFADFEQKGPRSATDRELMRSTTARAIQILEEGGVVPRNALTTSDFQALMWFYEKDLMLNLGANPGTGEMNDFVDGAIEALRKENIDDNTIAEALPDTERGRLASGADARREDGEPRESVAQTRNKLARFKSVKEKNDITRKQAEQIKKELDRGREPFYSMGFIPEEMERDRANFETTVRADVQNFQHKFNYSASSDFVAKILQGVKVGQSFNLGYSEEKAKQLSDLFIRKIQDRMIPVSRMVDELQEKGFKFTDAMNPVLQARLMQGKANEEVEEKRETLHKDVVETIGKLRFTDADLESLKRASNEATDPDQGGEGYIEVVMKDFMPSFWRRMLFGTPSKKLVMAETYLYALHAKERNNYVRQIDKNFINKFRDRGSGMSDREADAILNWFRNQERELPTLNDLRNKVQKIIDDTNEVRRTSGLQAMFLRGSNWTNYIPLRGAFDPEDETVDFNNAGNRKAPLFGSKGREDPVVKGRIDYAPNLIVNLFTQNANSIMRAAQNRVGQTVVDMIREDPVLLQEFATIQDVVPERMFVDARTGLLSKRPATRDDVAKDKNNLIVKENGNEIVVRFNSPVVAGAFRGDTGAGDAANNSYMRMANKFNRYLSSINTTFNPEFIFPNFLRDLQTAAINIDQYEGEALKRQVISKTASMAKAIFDAIQSNDYSSENAQIYRAFVKAGGKNVTNQMTTLGDQIADIENTLNLISEGGAKGKLNQMKENWAGKKVTSLLSTVENLNTAAENAVRVSTFKTLLDTGRYTEEQAALAAREITVNFARGGELKPIFNSLYLFFNASLQGTFALAEAATRSSKVRKLWVGLVFAGIFFDQVNALFSDEDEDGILVYDKTTDFTLEHNILIPNFAAKAMDFASGENVIQKASLSIPLPYGVNLGFNVGRSISRRLRGAYTPAQTTSSIMSTTFEALNPLGGMESWGNLVLPTVADPVWSLARNINYDRTPIYKQVSQFAVGTPDSQAYWNSASPFAVSLASLLNQFPGFGLGGNQVKSGMIDVSPDTLDFLFNYFTGGAGMFIQRSLTFGYDLTTGNVFDAFEDGLTGQSVRDQIRKTPLLRKAITSVSEREDTGKFIQKRNVIFGAKKELKNAIETRDMSEIRRVREKYRDELRIYGIIRAINTKRQKLTSLRNRLIRKEKTPQNKEIFEARIKQLDKQIQALIGRGNALMEPIRLDFFTEMGLTSY